MGDYDPDLKKARLFAHVRSGVIRIVEGSTQKMGTGTNVQQRLIALHHVDAPWKPAEVEQREGRILRQGNNNAEVEIYRYVTEGSFDAYMWQTLQTKAEFINQVMKGDMSIRRMEDMDDQTLSYAEVKAIASGNPAVLTLAKMDMEAQRLTQLSRAHRNEQYRIRQTIRQLEDADLPMLTSRKARIAGDIDCIEAHGGWEHPTLMLDGGQAIIDPKTAQEGLREAVARQWELLAFALEAAPSGVQERAVLGSFGGLEIQLTLEKGERISGTLSLKGQCWTSRSLRGPGSDRLLTYLYELAESLPTLEQEAKDKQTELESHLDSLQTRLGLPFEHEAKLTQLAAMRGELQALLQSDAPARPAQPDAGPVSEQDQTATSAPAPEAAKERIRSLVAAFDAMMKGDPLSAPATPGNAPEPPQEEPPDPSASRLWTERIRSRSEVPLQERFEVAL
jgi:hypothetical protein